MFGPFSLDMPYISITNPFPTHFLTYKNTKTAVCYDATILKNVWSYMSVISILSHLLRNAIELATLAKHAGGAPR